MRYIDLDKIRMPDGWIGRSKAAALKVAAGDSPDVYASIWRELKAEMALISHTKCWYCESSVDRDDNAVDHFRPKNRVAEALHEHSGYKWLAFNKNNFRLSCTYCNSRRIDIIYGTSGGKADRFPLLDESQRVYVEGSVEHEEPELLDPCDMNDCELLGCQQENGRPCSSSEDEIANKRVTISIEIYHLDRDPTCKLRHSVAVRLISDILDAKRLFNLLQEDKSKRQEFLRVTKNIERSINKGANFSGEMRYLVRGQRSDDHPWLQKLLEI